jgi:hypothetical protein
VSEEKIHTVKIRGTTFEPAEDGWCKHCGWASFGHVIGGSTGRLLCKADEAEEPATQAEQPK